MSYIFSRFTAADVILGYTLFWASLVKGGILLQGSQRVTEYLNRLKERPAFKETMGTAREWMTVPASYDNDED